ncbi:MAG TPA: hypothetical protein VFA67_06435 [Candidatus Sulfotelmatobacter sp.]|nr:hypothetical protein [Candidatus Sulfotelmatobacter sp.]
MRRNFFCESGSFLVAVAIGFALVLATSPLYGREKDTTQYGAGLIVNLPFPEADVAQAVQDVVQNGTIRGSKEYEREEYITGAEEATSARGFPPWQEGGKVFYKVRPHALDPRNFKESGDVGTVAVRYMVQAQGQNNTVLRIDSIFMEDFRHTVHPSNGSVEGAEYKSIHDHLETLQSMKQLGTQAQAEHRTMVSDKLMAKESVPATLPAPAAQAPAALSQPMVTDSKAEETPEQRLKNLRREVERVVKTPGAPLKASPFQSAHTLVSLPSGTEVLIVISTPYWYGVETHAGQHGWVAREQLELLP